MLTRLKSPDAAARWLDEWVTGTLRTDSRAVRPGDAFIAWPGYGSDGRRYVAQALAAGATTCVVEAEGVEAFGFTDARIAALPLLKAATGNIAHAFYGRPSERLRLVATTGTNGKTSTAWWTAQALTLLGQRCGVVGTLGVGQPPVGEREASIRFTGLTTPDPVTLHAALRRFAIEGYAACAMEASSIGIVEHRLDATHVEVALFTNFSRDHLDYHGTMEAYWAAKRQLFAWPGLRAAVVNIDDAQGAQLARELAGTLELWTYAVGGSAARLAAHDVGYAPDGLVFRLSEREGPEVMVRTTLIGDYNVSNLLAVIGGLRALGVPLADAAALCPQLTAVPGRMQRIGGHAGEPLAVVDYAHTPDALDKVLSALRSLSHARGGRLHCVFGCGGNRDASKRPLMGAIAERLADAVVVTSDNPRHEEPAEILRQIAAGLRRPQAVPLVEDRRAAIAQVLAGADPRDVVLIAGKGHEDYQEVAGVKQPFSDVAEALAALAARKPEVNTMMTLADAHAMLPGSTLVGAGSTAIARVHSDTRSLRAGDLFVALKGERFDAHDFLPQARAAGAVAALVQRADALPPGLPGLVVADARRALGQLAAAWRRQMELPLIAVTGSNGKTTVTQMIASILRAWHGDDAFATEGNFNNDIGLPLTLLRLRPHHRAGVVELGMNHPGEIAELAVIARPTVALVNNAQREHQEFMASVEAVARENGSVFATLPAQGVAVFPADDAAHTPIWQSLAAGRPCLSFALDEGGVASRADIRGEATWHVGRPDGGITAPGPGDRRGHWALLLRTPAGEAPIALRVPGRHNVLNAMAAAACALAAGAPWAAVMRGLESFQAVKGRSQLRSATLHGAAVTLIDDSYNANPDSVRAAIDVLAALPGPRWLVLGDMGEVGDQGPAFHAEVGALARSRGIEHLWLAGAACRHAADAYGHGARHFADAPALVAALGAGNAGAPPAASVLVKGSRFMKMETVVAALTAPATH